MKKIGKSVLVLALTLGTAGCSESSAINALDQSVKIIGQGPVKPGLTLEISNLSGDPKYWDRKDLRPGKKYYIEKAGGNSLLVTPKKLDIIEGLDVELDPLEKKLRFFSSPKDAHYLLDVEIQLFGRTFECKISDYYGGVDLRDPQGPCHPSK